MHKKLALAFIIFSASLGGSAAAAWDMNGRKTVILHTSDGTDIAIGSIDFTPASDMTGYTLSIDTSKFKEFFLSMRQFKCLEGKEIQCIVPYPYDNPHVIKGEDLSWLEHDLLFFFKAPNDYGAKMQNGLYYAMKITDQGLVGSPQAIDLEQIASPPADLTTPPYKPADRYDIGADGRWIESLRIE